MNSVQYAVAADEAEIRRVADELFITTDLKDWEAARALFTDGPIEVDMSSLAGGGPVEITADQLIGGFRAFRYYSKLTRGNEAVRTHTA